MLSYRHAFHAGNHADVLKHWVYSLVLDYFNQKDKAYWVVDTHAGAGVYRLEEAMANKTAEYLAGIARCIDAQSAPVSLQGYLNAVQACQSAYANTHTVSTRATPSPVAFAGQALSVYPGSPMIAKHFCRESDKLRLFELHPTDYARLAQTFAECPRQVQVQQKDGFDGIKASLPPPTKRAVVLIDPPYERKDDYARVVDCIKDSLKRFATGTYIVWYPMLQRPEPAWMVEKLKALHPDYVHVQLQVAAPANDGFGMVGSGLMVINPPWVLAGQLADGLPWLRHTLAQDDEAKHHLEVVTR